MTGIIWLAVATLFGWRLMRSTMVRPGHLLGFEHQTPWPELLLKFAMAFWIGVLPLTWLTYALGALFSWLLPNSIHPLLPANLIILIGLAAWLAVPKLRTALRSVRADSKRDKPVWAQKLQAEPGWLDHLRRSFKQAETWFFLIPLILFALLGLFIMFSTFGREGSRILAGYSVFSDFAPHTAVVSSFSQGQNWPTDYPHFAGDGIAYHFMFFFLCGNLNYLGLPLDLAINLPSLIGLMSFCVLLGLLAVQLTQKKPAFLIAPMLLFLRSSMAFFTYLSDLIRTYAGTTDALSSILQAIRTREVYIGNTPNDSWGLWGVNVYANQRHLLPGLSVALIILMIFLPLLKSGLADSLPLKEKLLARSSWLPASKTQLKQLALACLLGLLLPYFHGSALVSLLLVLAIWGVFSNARLGYLAFAAIALAGALIQSRIFTGQTASVISPSIQLGFISPDQSILGILGYLLEMSGIVLVLALAAFLLSGRLRKVMIVSFFLPLLFAFTISLTPDVTVNHKYIMISIALLNVYVADLLVRLWQTGKASASPELPETGSAIAGRKARTVLTRTLAVLLAIVLTVTGFMEINILSNISQKKVSIDTASPLVLWIRDNTGPKAVFITAPYHYNTFYLSGRMSYLGHAYYAWSAGHDTRGRLETEQWLLQGCGGDLAQSLDLIRQEGLDFLIIDDTLRNHNEFNVDETFFADHFTVAATFPIIGNMVIYNLGEPLED